MTLSLRRRFDRDESGAIAIETALVGSILAMATVFFLEIRATAGGVSKVKDSLQISSNYILAGGTDLEYLETLFASNYGRTPQSFVTALLCVEPPEPSFIEEGEDAEEHEPSDEEPESMRYDEAQSEPGRWAACPDPYTLRFLELAATDLINADIFPTSKQVGASLHVMLTQDDW